MNNSQINLNNYILLDTVYHEFTDDIDSIPLVLSEEDISTIEINDVDYISKSDYSKIKNVLYQKRNNKDILISKKSTSSNLIEFEPSTSDTSYFLNLIYELNTSLDNLLNENTLLKDENSKLKEFIRENL